MGEKLIKIGFTKREASIYLELLRIGSQAASTIAKRVNFNRTTCYSILKSLEKKGMVASYHNNNVLFYVANDPNCLIGYLDQRMRTFDYFKSEIKVAIPQFRALKEDFECDKPLVNYFEGLDGLRSVLNDSLTLEGEFCAYLNINKACDFDFFHFINSYKDFRLSNPGLTIRVLMPDTDEVKAFLKKYRKLIDYRIKISFLPYCNHPDLFKNLMNIYDKKVSILNFEKGREYAFLIEDSNFYNMQKNIFDLLWQKCKESNYEDDKIKG